MRGENDEITASSALLNLPSGKAGADSCDNEDRRRMLNFVERKAAVAEKFVLHYVKALCERTDRGGTDVSSPVEKSALVLLVTILEGLI
jgi:hypothetical protein